jgi:NAD(P) transhydrogenase subunit beta
MTDTVNAFLPATLAQGTYIIAALLFILDRRGGHAGRGVDAEQLFRLGGGGDRLLAVNDLLIVVGALVGSSGAILSYIMCKAMNRSFVSVILAASAARRARRWKSRRAARSTPKACGGAERRRQSVIIIPGYGMAVAQAQQSVSELTRKLRAKGKTSASHPPRRGSSAGPHERAAGRGQGALRHRAGDGRDQRGLPETDVVLVIGANDIVNPAAQEDPGSPIAGMPVLHVWEAANVIVFKRSMATGYAGVQNPLFFNENTQMLFGDAKERVDDIHRAIKSRVSA